MYSTLGASLRETILPILHETRGHCLEKPLFGKALRNEVGPKASWPVVVLAEHPDSPAKCVRSKISADSPFKSTWLQVNKEFDLS